MSKDFPPRLGAPGSRWIAAFYSGGQQIRSTAGNRVIDTLLEAFDLSDLRAEIKARLARDGPVSVFRTFPLEFAADDKKRLAGRTVNLRLAISPEGYFERIEPADGLDPAVALAASRQLRYWLFVPRTRDGAAVASTVVIPIKF